LICESEPLHPDLRRFNKKGLFGIILREPTIRTKSDRSGISAEISPSGYGDIHATGTGFFVNVDKFGFAVGTQFDRQ
jgi:hypothetical protein